MQLSQQALDEFKKIYLEDYDTALTNAQALELATSFLNFMRVLCRPIPDADCRESRDLLY